jgi:hypothetical protein
MAQPHIEGVVNAIASDTNTPPELVSKLCEDAWAECSDGARIMDYLPLLVAKRVRESLRQRGGETGARAARSNPRPN